VNIKAPNTQTVNQPLILECGVTTVKGITSRVEIVWSLNGTELERIEGVDANYITNNSSVMYTHIYRLNATKAGRIFQCEAIININPPVNATSSVVMLEMVGKLNISLMYLTLILFLIGHDNPSTNSTLSILFGLFAGGILLIIVIIVVYIIMRKILTNYSVKMKLVAIYP